MWRTIEADGCTWEVRVISDATGKGGEQDILEFTPREATRPPRRLAINRLDIVKLSDAELRAAYVKARPIGADFYGRPGKRMPDAS